MVEPSDKTTLFRTFGREGKTLAGTILTEVYAALKEKGYNPVDQIVGYLLSGDPTYITSHRDARSLISQVERDEILEELLAAYLQES